MKRLELLHIDTMIVASTLKIEKNVFFYFLVKTGLHTQLIVVAKLYKVRPRIVQILCSQGMVLLRNRSK